MTVSTNFQH